MLEQTTLTLPTAPVHVTAWAFAQWGGDFYFFSTEQPGSTTVRRYHPGGPPVAEVYASLPGEEVWGAGVSSCAPTD